MTTKTTELRQINNQLRQEFVEQPQAEQILSDSEATLHAILNNNSQLVVLVDRYCRIQMFNRLAEEYLYGMYGHKLQIGQSIHDYIKPEDKSNFKKRFSNALQNKIIKIEKEITARDNKKYWFEIIYNPVVLETGQVSSICFTARPIDEQKQTEQALRHQLALQKLAATISTNFINLSIDKLDDYINQTLKTIGEFCNVDRSYLFVFTEANTMDNTHEWCAPTIEPQIDHLQGVSLETLPWFREQIKQGQVVHVPWVSALPPEAEAEKIHWQAQDIQSLVVVPLIYSEVNFGFVGFDAVRIKQCWSEEVVLFFKTIGEIIANAWQRKQSQEALLKSEEQRRILTRAVEQTADVVMITDKKGLMLYVNPALEHLTGYTKEELLGQKPTIFQSGHHEAEFYENLWRTILAGHVFKGDFVNRKKDQSLYYEEKTINPVKNEQGQITHFVSTGRDVTERKQVEQAVRQRSRELALLNRASKAFISTLDLNEVLINILEETRHLLKVTACSAWLIDPKTEAIICRQATHPHHKEICGWQLNPGQGIVGWVIQHQQSLIVPDVRLDQRHFKEIDEQTGLELRSILSVPLRVKRGVIGAIQTVDTTVNRFKTSDLRLLESLAGTAAIAIENAQLYEQANQHAQTQAILLSEVNHRVKNNLAAIIGMLYAERRHSGMEKQTLYQEIMKDLINRIQGLATVHQILSVAKWTPIPLRDLTSQIIRSALHALPFDKQVTVDVTQQQEIRVTPKQANHLAIVINELTTNTIKYALAKRSTAQIQVHIALEDDMILFEFRDDGPGYSEAVMGLDRHHLGLYLIKSIASKGLRGEVALHNDHGAVALLYFPGDYQQKEYNVNQ